MGFAEGLDDILFDVKEKREEGSVDFFVQNGGVATEDIFDSKGQILIAEGNKITEKNAQTLKKLKLKKPILDTVQTQTQSITTKDLKNLVEQSAEVHRDVIKGDDFSNALEHVTKNIISNEKIFDNILLNLTAIHKDKDPTGFNYSLSNAVLSSLIAMRSRFQGRSYTKNELASVYVASQFADYSRYFLPNLEDIEDENLREKILRVRPIASAQILNEVENLKNIGLDLAPEIILFSKENPYGTGPEGKIISPDHPSRILNCVGSITGMIREGIPMAEVLSSHKERSRDKLPFGADIIPFHDRSYDRAFEAVLDKNCLIQEDLSSNENSEINLEIDLASRYKMIENEITQVCGSIWNFSTKLQKLNDGLHLALPKIEDKDAKKRTENTIAEVNYLRNLLIRGFQQDGGEVYSVWQSFQEYLEPDLLKREYKISFEDGWNNFESLTNFETLFGHLERLLSTSKIRIHDKSEGLKKMGISGELSMLAKNYEILAEDAKDCHDEILSALGWKRVEDYVVNF